MSTGISQFYKAAGLWLNGNLTRGVPKAGINRHLGDSQEQVFFELNMADSGKPEEATGDTIAQIRNRYHFGKYRYINVPIHLQVLHSTGKGQPESCYCAKAPGILSVTANQLAVLYCSMKCQRVVRSLHSRTDEL